MVTAKDIKIAPITAEAARHMVRCHHYSGKVVNNSQLNFGVFLNDRLEGAMQFGPSMDKSKLQGLVEGTPWNGFLELNRMAFSERLPRNSESRALGVAMRMIKKSYPHIQWIVSFSDAAQCGDGTIYRASGFVLTGISKNRSLFEFPNGARVAQMTMNANWNTPAMHEICKDMGIELKYRTAKEWMELGAKKLPGYQLRYLYFLDPTARQRLKAEILPFSKIAEMDAGMYRGQKISRG